ncbi:MAG: HAMP domain-containing protein [Gammaproteobacteria bacterium]|nr:HAMP domain-containing protein [Gammaproteobacteria bacterium]
MVAATLKNRRTTILAAIWVAVVLGALFALFISSQNSAQFGRLQPWILLASAIAVAVIIVLLARKIAQLVKAYRGGVPGSRLTSRTVLVFGTLVVLPLLAVYVFSLEFLNRGIDSWFRVEIKQGLNDAVVLSRSVLELRMREHDQRTQRFAATLAAQGSTDIFFVLEEELRNSGAREIVLYGDHARVIGAVTRGVSDSLPTRPPADLVRRVTGGASYVSLEPMGDSKYLIRTAAPLPGVPFAKGDARYVVAIYELPRQLAELTDAVQHSYSQYGDLAELREPLKYSFRLTLTMVLLVTLLGAIYGAIFSAEVLFKPVQDLMAGTRAVAKGDFGTRVPLTSHDEMGFLVQSFNDMTKRLRRAREETERSRLEVDREREQLEIILARLSAGVITVNRELIVQRVNESASSILGMNLADSVGRSLAAVAAAVEGSVLTAFVNELQTRFATGRDDWREQIELRGAQGKTGSRVLVCACVPLPQATNDPEKFVIVFDDVTHLLQAQRDAAWGEVARRLAHEIKNPLTPIQLSAERMRRKLLPGLTGQDADMVDRSTHTIVQQVESMKQMVNDFSEYARAPSLQLGAFDFNRLVVEVTDLYRVQEAGIEIVTRLDPVLGAVEADRSRVRQVLNNLLTNAFEALEGLRPARIELQTASCELEGQSAVELTVTDTGPGFRSELIERFFDPYVTTKPRGTGLGLAIVKKIVDDHGGRIEAENRREGGALVRVMLPIRDQSRSVVARAVRPESRRERA